MVEHIVEEARKNIEHYEDLKKYCTQSHCKDCANSCDIEIDYNKTLIEYLKMAKEYKELEEQGLLLRLPCKVGSTVWDNDYGKPCAYRITGFSFGTADNYIDEPLKETELIFYYENPSGSITGSFVVSEIGKTVFLTKEEAEKALADMGV